MAVTDAGLLNVFTQAKVEEFGVCEEGEIVIEIQTILLGGVVGGGDRIQICDVLGDIGCSSRTVARHHFFFRSHNDSVGDWTMVSWAVEVFLSVRSV